MRNIFEYTHTKSVSSSVVKSVHYNEDTGEVLVNLNGEKYIYSNVPPDRYEDLVNAGSVGNYFSTDFKPTFGPGKHVAFFTATTPVRPHVAPGRVPKNLTYAPGGVVTAESNTGNSVGAHVSLTYSEVAVNPKTVAPVQHKHAVVFAVDGLDDTKTYTLDAASVDDAVKALKTATDAIGLEVKVQSVTVYFD